MPDPNAISRLLTLVFTDLRNSTALKTQRGDTAVGELIRRHRELITRLTSECSGRIIDWAGDGCFLTFEVSSAGVLFGLRLQQAHADQSDLPQVRVGVHLGEVTERLGPTGDVRVEGLAVDIAARIGGLARPGQILMSSAVYHSARQRLGVETLGKPVLWQTHGPYTFKGFDEPLDISEAALEGITKPLAPDAGDKAQPAGLSRRQLRQRKQRDAQGSRGSRWTPRRISLLIIIVVAIIASRFPESSPPKHDAPASKVSMPIRSLAVLPLKSLSGDSSQEYFAEGMTDAITSELSKIKAIKVASRMSAMRFKNTDLSSADVAAKLGVDGFIEGSVQRDGDDVTVIVNLIDGTSERVRWSDTKKNTVKGVLRLQSDVALSIAEAIQVELTGDERARIDKAHEVNPGAYKLYVEGMSYRELGTLEQVQKSIALFEEATRLDPQFAEAWAALGYLYIPYTSMMGSDPQALIPSARAASLRALELDPDLPTAHLALGFIAMMYDREWSQAEERIRHSIELDPNYDRGKLTLGWYFMVVGRSRDAINQLNQIKDLETQDSWTIRNAAVAYSRSGEELRARELLESVLAANPTFQGASAELIQVHLSLGNDAEALAAADRYVTLSDQSSSALALASMAYALAGQTDRAREFLSEATASSVPPLPSSVIRALVALGDIDTAFAEANRAYESKAGDLDMIRNFPFRRRFIDESNFIRFRQDPRYYNLIARMKFPPLPPDHPGYAEEQAWLAKKKVR